MPTLPNKLPDSLVLDLDFIAQAAQQRNDYEAFRYYVELDERSDAELDALVESIARPIVDVIDCTQCANCCHQLNVYVTMADAQRLIQRAMLPAIQLLTHIIDCEKAFQVDEWGVFRQQPCVFLEGNLCRIYEHRPDSCRTYPVFTPDFRWTLDDILGGVGICPIIYNVIEHLQVALGW